MPMIGLLKRFRKSNWHLKLLLILFPVLFLFVFVYRFLIIPTFEEDIYSEKMLQTAEMVNIGLSILDHFYQLEQQGVLSRSEAQKEAAELIRGINYGEEKLDYFWINTYDNLMIVHPFRKDFEGRVLSDSDDPDDIYTYELFQRFIALCREQGAGHITYYWQYYDEQDRLEEKLSYVASFEPWDWIIGTGVYLVDLEMLISQRSNIASLFILLLGVAVIATLYYYSKSRVTEKELLESEEKYRIIAENTADTITILDLDLKYVYISPSIYKLQGYTVEEAMNRNLEQTLTPDSLQIALNTFLEEMSQINEDPAKPDKTVQLVLEEYKKDGSTIWVDNSLSLLRNEQGQPIAILSVARDITERKKQEESLRREQNEKSLILDNLAERVTYLDCDMRIVWANQAVMLQEGKSLDSYIGEKCYKVWHGYDEPCSGCPIVKALQTGEVSEGVVVYPDDRFWKMTGSPVYDKSGRITGVLDTALEISDLKKAERELKNLNEELEARVRERTEELIRANKELAAFTYSVSHDLRSPLRGISGFTEAVLEDYGERLNRQGRDYLERVLKATARMNELIDDLLKLSRVTRQEIHNNKVDLSAMVVAYSTYLQEEEPDRKVEFRIQPGCTVTGDAALLRIALENLINNAWKYTGKMEQPQIEFGQYEENGKNICYVKDNGVGFNMAYREKIFNAFHRLHTPAEYPGTGVGLSIVQRIVERHGGEIWAVSEEGKGAVFYFSIPS